MTLETLPLKGLSYWITDGVTTETVENLSFCITEETLYLGKDGQPYGTEEEALATFGYALDDNHIVTLEWVDVSTLGDKAKYMMLTKYTVDLRRTEVAA